MGESRFKGGKYKAENSPRRTFHMSPPALFFTARRTETLLRRFPEVSARQRDRSLEECESPRIDVKRALVFFPSFRKGRRSALHQRIFFRDVDFFR